MFHRDAAHFVSCGPSQDLKRSPDQQRRRAPELVGKVPALTVEERMTMDNTSNGRRVTGPRLIALVGPFQSGKTTLLESLLARAGALARPGNVRDGSTVGDSSAEARAHFMSV